MEMRFSNKYEVMCSFTSIHVHILPPWCNLQFTIAKWLWTNANVQAAWQALQFVIFLRECNIACTSTSKHFHLKLAILGAPCWEKFNISTEHLSASAPLLWWRLQWKPCTNLQFLARSGWWWIWTPLAEAQAADAPGEALDKKPGRSRAAPTRPSPPLPPLPIPS